MLIVGKKVLKLIDGCFGLFVNTGSGTDIQDVFLFRSEVGGRRNKRNRTLYCELITVFQVLEDLA